MHTRRLAPTLLTLTMLAACRAPVEGAYRALGAELQAYPAGVISTVHAGLSECGEAELRLHAGWNETDREDWGDHHDEQGGGPGLGFSGRRYFGEGLDGWFIGARADLWFLEIDWIQNPGTPLARSGDSDVIVLQPTVFGGYRWALGDAWALELSVAGGAEINVHTSGEDVGEGAIGLLGLSLSYGF